MDDSCTDSVCATKCTCEPLEITHTSWTILTGTIYETAVHQYVSNKEGPGIAIVGGIHGDETAGWNAALELVEVFADSDSLQKELFGMCGTVLIIPQANIAADKAEERFVNYPNASNGIAIKDGVKYSDLNRSFPLGRYATATATTISISNAIVKTVETFGKTYGFDYIIDLHEARRSWELGEAAGTTTLGDTLIYNNQPMFMSKMLKQYNKAYRPTDEPYFTNAPANQKGSYSYYFTNTYPDSVVYTIETNRSWTQSTGNAIPLEKRVRQQLNVLQAMFDLSWNRI